MTATPSAGDMSVTEGFIGKILRREKALKHLSPASLNKLEALLTLVDVEAGAVLMRQGDRGDAMYFLVRGSLDVRVKVEGEEQSVAILNVGAPVGETQLLTGGIRTASVYAMSECTLLKLSADTLTEIQHNDTELYGALLDVIHERQRQNQLYTALRNIVGEIDSATLRWLAVHSSWCRLKRGEVLFRKGDPGRSWYILLDGLLDVRSVDKEGQEITLNKIRRGASFGEAALITDDVRTATIVAAKHSDLVEITREAFDALKTDNPAFLPAITKVLVKHLTKGDNATEINSVTIIGLTPLSEAIDLDAVGAKLYQSLSRWGQTTRVNVATLTDEMDLPQAALSDLSHPAWRRINVVMGEITQDNRFIILEFTEAESAWTEFCTDLADCFVLLAEFNDQASLTPLNGDAREKILVLNHPPKTSLPRGTKRWLDAVKPTRHFHFRGLNIVATDRIGRQLAGKSLGLVLGGGGARGFAHIGVWRALQKENIPVDFIAGTSIGSVIAGNIAMGLSESEIVSKQRKLIALKPFMKITLPMISLVKAEAIDAIIRMSFRDIQIEDLWLPYFCVSADLTSAQPVVHTSGALWKATRASSALPVITAPVLHEGHLLVDGGLFNNLPGDLMRSQGAGYVVAVSVSPQSEFTVKGVDLPSGWKLLADKVLPWRETQKLPGLADILIRSMVLPSAQRLGEVEEDVDLLLSPPINDFGMLQFEAIDELIAIGYSYTVKKLAEEKPSFLKQLTALFSH